MSNGPAESPWKVTPSKICGLFVVLFGTLLFFQLGALMLCVKRGADISALLVVSFGGGIIILFLTAAIGFLITAFTVEAEEAEPMIDSILEQRGE
jgi:hypothetical protein